jgi:hypothetical protein
VSASNSSSEAEKQKMVGSIFGTTPRPRLLCKGVDSRGDVAGQCDARRRKRMHEAVRENSSPLRDRPPPNSFVFCYWRRGIPNR